MKTSMKMLAAVSVAAIMCICPAIVMADGSDAYTKTDGDGGLSVEFSTTDTAQIDRFYSAYAKVNMARNVLDSFAYTAYSWTITDIAITSLSYERGIAAKISGDDGYNYEGETVKFKMTFTATLDSTSTLFEEYGPYILAAKAINTDNKGAVGDKFEVSVEATTKESGKSTAEFGETDAADFFMKQQTYDSYQLHEYDIDAKFIKASDSSETKFSVDYKMESGYNAKIEMDLNGVGEGAVTADTAIYATTTATEKGVREIKCTVGDDSKSDSDSGYEGGHQMNVDKDVLMGEDIKVPTMYYVTGGEAVLVDISFGDATLATEDGFKSFLSDVGAKTSTSYSDAKSVADDAYSDIVTDEDLALGIFAIAAIALGLLVVVLIIVIVVILIVKRKK